jgi:hypothetical protein
MKYILLAAGLALAAIPVAAQDGCQRQHDAVTGRIYGCGVDTGPLNYWFLEPGHEPKHATAAPQSEAPSQPANPMPPDAKAQNNCRQHYDVVTGRVYGCDEDTGPRYSYHPSQPTTSLAPDANLRLLTDECVYRQLRTYAFAHPEEHFTMPTFDSIHRFATSLGQPASPAEVDNKCLMAVQAFIGMDRALRSIGGW